MIIDIVNLKLSVQRALLGNVFPKLRAVCVDSKENYIFVGFYCDGELSEDEHELYECMLDQLISDFYHRKPEGEEGVQFDVPIVSYPYPQKMPLVGHWVYYRHEN